MEAAAYESLDHWRIKFLSQHMVTTETYPYFKCFIHKRSPVQEKKEKFLLSRKMITLQHLIILFPLCYWWTGDLQEVNDKGKFHTFSSGSGRSCLQEVVTYKRFQIEFDLETFGILENWLLRRGGRNWWFDRNLIIILLTNLFNTVLFNSNNLTTMIQFHFTHKSFIFFSYSLGILNPSTRKPCLVNHPHFFCI